MNFVNNLKECVKVDIPEYFTAMERLHFNRRSKNEYLFGNQDKYDSGKYIFQDGKIINRIDDLDDKCVVINAELNQ